METLYIAVWILLMITTVFLLYIGNINPLTIAVLFLLLLVLCLEAVWLLYFGTWFTTKDDQVKKNKFYGGN
jgi:hypothetical protein